MEEKLTGLTQQQAQRLQRLEEADRAKAYLSRVLDIGQLMLQSGGEVSRVEDSIRRLCVAFGAERADVFSITSSIIVTISSPAYGTLTQTRRVAGADYDLTRLEQLNQLSRRICSQQMSLEEMEQALKEIGSGRGYSFRVQVVAWALVSASFSLFFGGSAMDAAASAVVGVFLKFFDRVLRRVEVNSLLSALLSSVVGGALAAVLVRLGLGESVDMISIGNIMLLIPGIALTNSLRDMFSGNTMTGMLRFLEAIIKALVIAFGFALVLAKF